MNKSEMERRDQVLRAYFQGRDWDENNEYVLTRHLVLNSYELLPDYPLIIDDQWEAEPNRNQEGEGDLLFADGEGRFAVVEVKWIDLTSSGDTASTRRTKKRKKVKEQAANYACSLAQRLDTFVQIEGYWFTNEYPSPQLAKKLPE
jgi:Holliday junction resolvase-like predicted endonuclease